VIVGVSGCQNGGSIFRSGFAYATSTPPALWGHPPQGQQEVRINERSTTVANRA